MLTSPSLWRVAGEKELLVCLSGEDLRDRKSSLPGQVMGCQRRGGVGAGQGAEIDCSRLLGEKM